MNAHELEGDPWDDEGDEQELAILPRRRDEDDTEMDITPMIDITFLLLIFFLVASKMDQAGAVTLPPAKHGLPVVDKNAVIVTVVASGGPEGSGLIFKGNSTDASNRLRGADPEAQEEELVEFIEKECNASSPPKTYVLIKAEKEAKQKLVDRVYKAAGKAETVQKLYVAVLETSG